MRRLAVVLGAVVLGAAALVLTAVACTDSQRTESTATAAATPPYAVETVTETFVDESRATAPNPNGGFGGAPERTLPTTIWFPDAEGPFPLVVFSHGVNSRNRAYEALVERWAEAGYVVAAPNHPLGSADAPGVGPTIQDAHEQSRDASFVVDEVLAHPTVGPRVDEGRIAAAGHSLGGVTAAGFAFGDELRDPRVRSAILFAAPPVATGGLTLDRPLLMIHGDADVNVPIELSEASFERAPAPTYLVTLLGASHTPAFEGTDGERSEVVVATTLDFLAGTLDDDAEAMEQLLVDGDVPGVATVQAKPR